ncbi:hypothetical protein KIPB_009319, partial [Kipferlia bialata]|eukprot:g9319.t1
MELGEAQGILDEASAQIQSIEQDGEQLGKQWQVGLRGLARRNEHLTETQTALTALEDELVTRRASLKGAENDILKSQEELAQVAEGTRVAESEKNHLASRLSQIHEETDRVQQRLNAAHTAVQRIAAEVDAVKEAKKGTEREIDRTEVQIQGVTQQAHLASERAKGIASETEGNRRITSAASKGLTSLQEQVTATDTTVRLTLNQVERAQLDILSAKELMNGLQANMDEMDAEVKAKGAVVERYETQIRRNSDMVEKRASDIARFMAKLDEYKQSASAGTEDTGPLEATLHNLSKEIQSMRKDSRALEDRWLARQGDLVSLLAKVDLMKKSVRQKTRQKEVLEDRLRVIEEQIQKRQKDIAQLKRDQDQAHAQLQRLNLDISRGNDERQAVEKDNLRLQSEFVAQLAVLEEKAKGLEAAAVESRNNRQAILNEILEIEKQ